MKLKYMLHHVDEREVTPEIPLMSVSKFRGVIRRSEISDNEGRSDDISNYKTCKPNDLVINRMAAYQGALGIANEFGAISPDYMVLRILRDFNPSYLGYFFKSHWMHSQMSSLVKGIGSIESTSTRTPRLSWTDLKELDIKVPPLAEQESIANFLDRELAQIDALIAKQQQLLRLAKKRLASKLNMATWENFDDQDILENARFGAVVRLVSTKGMSENIVSLDQIESGTGKRVTGTFNHSDSLDEESRDGPAGTYFESGDVLFGKLRPYLAKVWLADACGSAFGDFYVLRSKVFTPRYLRYLLLSDRLISRIDAESYGAKMPRANWDSMRQILIPVPKRDVQERIASILDDEFAWFDSVSNEIMACLKLMQERRQSLISAAVTGKIKVRKVA